MASIPRSSTPTRFALELGGVMCGFLKSVDGGGMSADIVVEPAAAGAVAKKHIGAPKFEDFVLGLELGLHRSVFDWIADSWKGTATTHDGAVVEADDMLKESARREFSRALLTETTIPAFDAASKTPGHLTIKFAPESTVTRKGGGGVAGKPATKQAPFVTSNFRLELDGLDAKRVTKIDAFTVKQIVQADVVGDMRDFQSAPTSVEFPNLRVTLAEADAKTWSDWFDDFVVKGNNTDDREKHGAIVLLDPTLARELMRIELENVGIFALRRAPAAAEQLPRLVADLYVEAMKLSVSASELAEPEPESAPVQEPVH